MLTSIDHVVIAVADLATARKRYAALGFTVVPGGRHPVATHNALIGFGDGSYVELIAFYEDSPGHKWWTPLQKGGGLVDFCMQTDDLRGDTEAFRKAGVEIDDPAPLSRVRPDGYRLAWVLSIPRGGHRGVAPFLIQDETPRAERVPRETTHANGVTGIGTVTVAVRDVAPVARWYAEVLRRPGRDVKRPELDGAGVRFTVGSHTLDFVAPRGSAGPLAEWLAARGASPYAATLRGGKPGALDPENTLGARLTLVG
jgi:catechol 2,3-dioxygenase-like lactoylglutathione lyase family enzyme